MQTTLIHLSLLYYLEPFIRAAAVTLMPALSVLILFRLPFGLFSPRDRSVTRCLIAGYTLAFLMAPAKVGYVLYDLVLLGGAGALAIVLLWPEFVARRTSGAPGAG